MSFKKSLGSSLEIKTMNDFVNTFDKLWMSEVEYLAEIFGHHKSLNSNMQAGMKTFSLQPTN